MKKILLFVLVSLLVPLTGFAAPVDSIEIDPVIVSGCGIQSVKISGTASYQFPISKLRVLDGNRIIYDKHHGEDKWSVEISSMTVGTHKISVRIMRMIVPFVWSTVLKKEINVVIPECSVPVDVCPNIEGEQLTLPEGMELIGGICSVVTEPIICDEGYQLVGESCELIPAPVTPSPASVHVGKSLGFAHPCSLIKEYSDMPCDYSEELRIKFALDEQFRELVLVPWRAVVFGGVKLK